MVAVSNPIQFTNILGQPVIEPSIASRWSFDELSANRFVAIHDVVLMGQFDGGPPNTLLPFIGLSTIRDTFDPENLQGLSVSLADYLIRPSFDANVRGAYRIYVLRLGTPTKATLTVQDVAPANVMLLTSTDYGSYVNKISVEIGAGTVVGKRVLLRFRQETLTLDNLKNAFHVAYTGNASAATMTITRAGDVATRLQTALTSPTDGSINLDLDLTQDTFATIQQLVQYLNGQNGYNATIDRYAAPLLPSSELDIVSAATIRTPVALNIDYVGAGSACTMSTTNTALTTVVTGGPGGETLAIDLTAAATDTLGELVAYIDGLAAYSCTLGANADKDALCSSLFTVVTTVDINGGSPYALTARAGAMDYVSQALLGSVIYAVNSRSTRVVASRVTSATTAPANLAQTFLAGGTSPTPSTQDWLNGLDVVAQEDLDGAIVFPVSSSPVIQDAVLAWVVEQRTTRGAAYRTFFGTPVDVTDVLALSTATGQNSTFASTAFQGGIAANGSTSLPPLYTAAMIAGAAAGALPTQPITQFVLRYRGLTRKYPQATRENFESNGLCVLREDKGAGVRLALALTTSLSEDRPDRMLSESMARDFIEQTVRQFLRPLIPHWSSWNFMPIVQGSVLAALQSLARQDVITKGMDAQGRILPAWLPPVISLHAGLLRVTLHVFIGGELDHIDIDGVISYQTFDITMTATP